ncbi:hypothetical protein CP8484711_0795A, partial [Chlamydia psittaci 84-8471/1]
MRFYLHSHGCLKLVEQRVSLLLFLIRQILHPKPH